MLTLAPECPVCASATIFPVLELPPVPIDTCRMWPSRAGARSAQKAPLFLSRCNNCTHVFNRAYEDELVDYEDEYENSQIFSQRFRQYAEELSDQLIRTYGLYNKNVVEIGGGKGDFLRIICDRGNNFGVSFGPSYKPEPDDRVPPNVRFVADYYTAKYANEPVDLIICRHVLEHFREPRQLITVVREAIGHGKNVFVYFEVPNGSFILQEQICWDFIYQHRSYFTGKSLATLFAQCGFGTRNLQERFGGQFLSIEARAVSDDARAEKNCLGEGEATAASEMLTAWCEAIGPAFAACRAYWSNYFEQQRVRGRRIILWGAGAKAVTFLNVVDPAGSVISHVVDVNPRKAGRFIAGSGQEIVEPSALRELRPDVIVLMNPIYREEIGSAVRTLGLDPELFLG
jgi:C-methyltransferase C-terminal domain/Methyltransferase domain